MAGSRFRPFGPTTAPSTVNHPSCERTLPLFAGGEILEWQQLPLPKVLYSGLCGIQEVGPCLRLPSYEGVGKCGKSGPRGRRFVCVVCGAAIFSMEPISTRRPGNGSWKTLARGCRFSIFFPRRRRMPMLLQNPREREMAVQR